MECHHLGWQPICRLDSLYQCHHRVGSISSQVVTMDEVDRLVGEGNQAGQSMPGEKRA